MRESRDQNERLLNVIAAVAGQLDLLRRATDAEAAERERQFRTLANSISQLAWMADREGYIFWYNDRWYRLHRHDARADAGLGLAESPSSGRSRPRRGADQDCVYDRSTMGGHVSLAE